MVRALRDHPGFQLYSQALHSFNQAAEAKLRVSSDVNEMLRSQGEVKAYANMGDVLNRLLTRSPLPSRGQQ